MTTHNIHSRLPPAVDFCARVLIGAVLISACGHPYRTYTHPLRGVARLHVTTTVGHFINEEGPLVGTLNADLTVTVNRAQQTFDFVAATPNGRVSGEASAITYRYSFGPRGWTFTFQGTGSIVSGTGMYSHAKRTTLRLSGTSSTYGTIATITGILRY
jgi:hypothetical protein